MEILLPLLLLTLVFLLRVVYDNCFPSLGIDDLTYCTAAAVTGTEADLGNAIQLTAAAVAGATSLTVAGLNAAVASGTLLVFPTTTGGTTQVTVTAAAIAGATSLTVAALGAAIANNSYALNQGTPVVLPAGTQSVTAVVQLTIAGGPASNTMYVALQTDLGDGNWVDVSTTKSTATTNGTTVYQLSAGLGGGSAPAVQRANGTAPGSNATNAGPLGPRIRFTGQATLSGGSSPTVKATIRYKVQGLR
jgi:hypothetical protein